MLCYFFNFLFYFYLFLEKFFSKKKKISYWKIFENVNSNKYKQLFCAYYSLPSIEPFLNFTIGSTWKIYFYHIVYPYQILVWFLKSAKEKIILLKASALMFTLIRIFSLTVSIFFSLRRRSLRRSLFFIFSFHLLPPSKYYCRLLI